jgi:hypothetical protein
MTTWTSDELTKIGEAEELQISSLRSDGTMTNPVTIWVVRVGNDLYVRAVNGRTGVWFKATQVRHEGHISAGYVDKDVSFVDADPGIFDQVDTVYRTKYHHYSKTIVHTDLTPQARASTLKLLPR